VSTSFSVVDMAVSVAVRPSQKLGFMFARPQLNALKYGHSVTYNRS